MKPESDDDKAQEAFLVYAAAKTLAEATMDYRDAVAAGRAWVRFLNVFLPDHRQMPVSNVVKFPAARAAR